MTLGRRMTGTSVLLIVSLLVLGAVPLIGIWRLQRRLDLVSDEFRELRSITEAQRLVMSADAQTHHTSPDLQAALKSIREARSIFEEFLQDQENEQHISAAHRAGDRSLVDQILAALDSMAGDLKMATASSQANTNLKLIASTDDTMQLLHRMSDFADGAVESARQAARNDIIRSMALTGAMAIAIAIVGIMVSVGQYRVVMRPLRRLADGVREIAAGHFSNQLDTQGDVEFAQLAGDFNHMASELDTLYRELERKVEIKSRELVRSERLAGIGFLAAGVAHEINNPLGVISGNAELMLRQIDHHQIAAAMDNANGNGDGHTDGSRPPFDEVPDTQQALRLIRDEAFRCKQIIGKLLSLARTGPQIRSRVDLAEVVDQVVQLVETLPIRRGRRITLELDRTAMFVDAEPAEMKQVLLNLTVNALQAAPTGNGLVHITGRRVGPRVQIAVTDNGCGMTADTLEHVFEPFFTMRRTDGEAGTGLGLSVTHAIIESHGGRIAAASDGPGRGSRFIIELPVASTEPPARPVSQETAEHVTR